jgi:hypothetical protein
VCVVPWLFVARRESSTSPPKNKIKKINKIIPIRRCFEKSKQNKEKSKEKSNSVSINFKKGEVTKIIQMIEE